MVKTDFPFDVDISDLVVDYDKLMNHKKIDKIFIAQDNSYSSRQYIIVKTKDLTYKRGSMSVVLNGSPPT